MTIRAIWKKTAAILLAFTVLAVSLPTLVMQAAEESSAMTADPSTMDAWKTFFGNDAVNAGAVWTDRSVFTDAAAFADVGITMPQDGEHFLVALSAMASTILTDDHSAQAVSGEICFTDPLGDFMTVSDIKGVLIDNVLFSGATLAKNFVPGGGDLGSYEQSTLLGDEMVRSIRARLGVDADTARSLIGLAYREGQLRYTSDTDFSNYIGWYANAAGEFLGFWYEGMETMPDPADPVLTDATRPAYVVRSYGYLGADGVDMMYATVQVRKHLQSGAEDVRFYMPATLMPTVMYHVTADDDMVVTGDEHPVRLVYEVALNEDIDAVSIHEHLENGVVSSQVDGSVVFCTNRVAISSFVPSAQNAYYYFQEDSVIFSDANGTLYKGDKPDVDAQVYTAQEGSVSAFKPVSSSALAHAQQKADGTWYIPVGTVRTDAVQNGIVCETHDQTGRLTMIPETGIVLETVADDADPNECFDYVVTCTDRTETADYKAVLRTADGETHDQRVLFEDGIASVTLSPGETLSIYGMSADANYCVTQRSHEYYKLVAVNDDSSADRADLTTVHRRFVRASFTNARKGYGGVTIVKRILHDFGTSYEIPDKRFMVRVTLSEDYAEQTLPIECSGAPTVTSVRTDENASFVVELGHADQLELLRLKEGTVVSVEELEIPEGFVPVYYGAGIAEASSVTIQANTAVSILILNRYTYEEVEEINITVSGTSDLVGRENDEWLDTDTFVVDLQRYENGGWITIASETVAKDIPHFDFTQAMQAERFVQSGVYSYRVIERIGDIAGIAYDHTVHTFSVTVGDEGMCGHLHILDVISHHDHTHVDGEEQNAWHIRADFTNMYYEGGYAEAVLDIRNTLFNPSGSDRVSLAGYRYGLFDAEGATPVFVSDYTDMVGEARLIASFDKSGDYTFVLRELRPENPLAGMIYSDEVYRVTVTVTENTVGTLIAHVHIVKDSESVDTLHFTNSYMPQSAALLPDVTTELTGRTMNDDEFLIRIQESGATLVEGTNDTNGKVEFARMLEFTAVGDYYYDVIQVSGGLGGVMYDPIVYHLHITVTDGGDGALVARYHVINTAVDTITFRNMYEVAPVNVIVSGVKQLIGRDLINEEFTFVLVDADDSRGTILSASNYSDGSFRFEPLVLREEGIYRYTVHEVFESVAHGIVFDDTVYDVTVTVTDGGHGVLYAQTAVCKGGEDVEQILFVNEYVTTPAEVVLIGLVQTDGVVSEQDVYTFELYETDENGSLGQPIDAVQNDGNGKVVFALLRFDTEGVYDFVVRQQHGGEIHDGIVLDAKEYRVRVDVTDNRRGTIFAQVTLFDADRTVVETMVFENTSVPEVSGTTTTVTTTGSATTATSVASTTVANAMIATTTTVGTTSTTTSVASITTTMASSTTLPTSAAEQHNPPTGDFVDLALWFVLLVVSGAVSITVAVNNKKRT